MHFPMPSIRPVPDKGCFLPTARGDETNYGCSGLDVHDGCRSRACFECLAKRDDCSHDAPDGAGCERSNDRSVPEDSEMRRSGYVGPPTPRSEPAGHKVGVTHALTRGNAWGRIPVREGRPGPESATT